MSVYVQSHL